MDALRDWGHAKDYVRMQWMMLQQEKPEDFVIATGQQHSVRDFVNIAASKIGIDITWKGSGVDEKGYFDGRCIIKVDKKYFRASEVETLLGNPSKAKKLLGWTPEITFDDLVSEMIFEDLKIAKRDLLLSDSGYTTLSHNE
jgi:GDPmannose 4,6-dehydratase